MARVALCPVESTIVRFVTDTLARLAEQNRHWSAFWRRCLALFGGVEPASLPRGFPRHLGETDWGDGT